MRRRSHKLRHDDIYNISADTEATTDLKRRTTLLTHHPLFGDLLNEL